MNSPGCPPGPSPPVIVASGGREAGSNYADKGGSPAGGSWNRKMSAIYLLLTCFGLVLGMRLVENITWVLPRCGLRTLTGIPCPLCGTTRCLMAWSKLEVSQAFQFNPFAALAFLGFWVWALLWVADGWTKRDWTGRLWKRMQTRPWPAVLGGVVVLNWIYLCIWLPK